MKQNVLIRDVWLKIRKLTVINLKKRHPWQEAGQLEEDLNKNQVSEDRQQTALGSPVQPYPEAAALWSLLDSRLARLALRVCLPPQGEACQEQQFHLPTCFSGSPFSLGFIILSTIPYFQHVFSAGGLVHIIQWTVFPRKRNTHLILFMAFTTS